MKPATRELAAAAGGSVQTSGVMKSHQLDQPSLPARLALVALLAFGGAKHSSAAEPEILVLNSSEEAGGTKQADFDMAALKMFERRSLEMLRAKMTAYLRSQGQPATLPEMRAESHYVESQGVKLAVVRVRGAGYLNQVFIYGVRGDSFHRVACARTRDFDQAVPLFYGPCGEKIKQVFGVALKP